ncbi:hypothetical protein [Pseudaestuariivita sp.]|uniref:hypothetical protein n=1 Tax=Pseudaestuariivita sp. TaxID=2211669 RepID=UPI00405A44B4
MTINTPQGDLSVEDQLDTLERQLRVLRQNLATWSDEAAAGDMSSGATGKRMLTEVSGWIRSALDLEKRLDERKRDVQGIAPGKDYALDFDAARREIGCRLARLRTCGGPE